MSKKSTYERQKIAYIEFESLSREFDFRKSDLINLIQKNDLVGFNELTGKNLKKIDSARAYIRVLNRFEEKAVNIDKLPQREQKYYSLSNYESKIEIKRKTFEKQSKFKSNYEKLQEKEREREYDYDDYDESDVNRKIWKLSNYFKPFFPKINGKNVSEEIYRQERQKDGLNKLMVGFNWDVESINLYELMNDSKKLTEFLNNLEQIKSLLYEYFESAPYSANFIKDFPEMAFTLKYSMVGTKTIESYLRIPFSFDFKILLEKIMEMVGLEENLEYNMRDVSRAFQSIKLDELDESISLKEVRIIFTKIF